MYYVQVVCQERIPNLSFNICVLGAIGMDCSTLGISSSNKPNSVTQVLYDDGMNHGKSQFRLAYKSFSCFISLPR